jgi:hypothetical protein
VRTLVIAETGIEMFGILEDAREEMHSIFDPENIFTGSQLVK